MGRDSETQKPREGEKKEANGLGKTPIIKLTSQVERPALLSSCGGVTSAAKVVEPVCFV